MSNTAWKTDNYKFVGKAFDYAYANRLNKLLAILGEQGEDGIRAALAKVISAKHADMLDVNLKALQLGAEA